MRIPRTALRAVSLIVVVALAAGCSSSARKATDDRPLVLTTFSVLADIASNIAGNRVRVESITKVGAEIHGYEPTPGDLKSAEDADLILVGGLGLEAWFERFVAHSDAPRVIVSDGIVPIDIAGGAYEGRPNPHAWMSPANVQLYGDAIAAALASIVPEHADEFTANASRYRGELQQVRDDLAAALRAVPQERRALVTCEGAFSYLARDAGLTERYLWPVNAEQQVTAQQITAVIEFVRDNEVPAVFCESTVSDAAMRQVVEATGTSFGGTLYVDSLSAKDGPVPTYLDLIRYDAEFIAAGLTGGTQ
ncbi:metal ABC transporter substrate-binding protein [Rarobacter faecitabidus]|uniref:Manganese transport system substrate-binding protein n=1 Tax=Rarobacter faecitabidus TaxID=13243 RepID=A0A542ZWR8_RARFA|nr:metal ABC transporter substrate-binding protein [Rarobacter faecitabidus]TQL64797.1 manganese transport system substrate-binding protein [Rarobacter faecitabidus]